MAGLSRADLHPDPIEQFRIWYDEARAAELPEPHAVALASSTACGRPSVRMVLLKGYDDRGFLFSTNYGSRKARELAENPRASLLFYWRALHRQVRVEGAVARAEASESDAIFSARPRGARISAWVSNQSAVIPDREELLRSRGEIEQRYSGDVPRPPHWGAFRLAPEALEFWCGDEDRLHDRFVYSRTPAGDWRIQRLAP